jgi:hypothetical protein
MHRAKNITVVGHGNRGHAKFMNPVNKFLNVASAVEQRIIAVQMEVDELVLAHEALGPLLNRPLLQVRFVSGYAFRHTENAVLITAPSGAGLGDWSLPTVQSGSDFILYWLEEFAQ